MSTSRKCDSCSVDEHGERVRQQICLQWKSYNERNEWRSQT